MDEDDEDFNSKRHAEEVGCFGFSDGIAKNLHTHKIFFASTASKTDGPFYCQACFSDAVLRKCIDKKDHFAHKTPLSPVIPKGESDLHFECKTSICEKLSILYPSGKWAVERPIPENKDKNIPALRPDISGRINSHPIAIEVQASSLTIPKIVRRTKSYAKRNIAILWVVPLLNKLAGSPFRPRQYERYFHSIYYGNTYYWWPGLEESIIPVHYGVAKRYMEYSSWHENGELKEAGDYDKAYKVIKTPEIGEPLKIGVDFDFHKRGKFVPENEKKEVPECYIWKGKNK